MALLPPFEVPAGWPRRVGLFWFGALVAAFVAYGTYSIISVVEASKNPTTSVKYLTEDLALSKLSFCSNNFLEDHYPANLLKVLTSCWDTRNPSSPKLSNLSLDASTYPTSSIAINSTLSIPTATLPGDCYGAPILVNTVGIPAHLKQLYKTSDHMLCFQFSTDVLPGFQQDLGKYSFNFPSAGMFRLTVALEWDRPPNTSHGVNFRSFAAMGFADSSADSEFISTVLIPQGTAQIAQPAYVLKEYLNGSRLVQQAWTLTTQTQAATPEYPNQFSGNSTAYQLLVTPNALGIPYVKEVKQGSVLVLLSQLASAWSAVLFLFGMMFSKVDEREFVLQKPFERRLSSWKSRRHPPGEKYGEEKNGDWEKKKTPGT